MTRLALLMILALTFAPFVTLPPGATAQAPAGPYAQQIRAFEQFAQEQMAAEQAPGLSVGFSCGDVTWANGYGYADLENKTPMTARAMHRLASVSKPMTAVAVLQLVEKGKINLDAEVQTYVPYFPKKKWPVTVRQLLGHLGGISHYKNYDLEGHFTDHKNTRQAIAVFENFDLVAEPGTRYNYTSYGYNLLGAVIEGASGQSFGDYMRQNVWGPAGMDDTRLDDPTDVIPNRARGYRLVNGQVKNSEFINISSRFAAGGTRSTALDMIKFARGLNEGKLLSQNNVGMMYDSLATKQGILTGYGMGWGTFPLNGQFAVSHSGGQAETSTLLYSFPNKKLVIAAAMNFEDGNPGPYVARLFELLTGEAWNVNPHIAERKNLPLYLGMAAGFRLGRAHFERHQAPLTTAAPELTAAFTYFNETMKFLAASETPETGKRINDGAHPVAGQPFAKMGSYMAQKLSAQHGPKKLAEYSNTGAISFFHDYIQLYANDSSIPAEYRFSKAAESVINDWQAGWGKSNTAAARQQAITAKTDLNALEKLMRQQFSGASAYPDYGPPLAELVPTLFLAGKIPQAKQAGQLAVGFYPGLDAAHANYGLLLALTDDRAKGVGHLRRALELNPNGSANANGLNNIAYWLDQAGRTDEGLSVLEIAVELFPKEANLYDSIGELQLKKGNKEKAKEFYQKALAIDPNYPAAENARAVLKRLEQP